MIIRTIRKFIYGFSFSVAITLVIQIILMLNTGNPPLLQEFSAHFDSQVNAFAFQLLLIGLMSGITSAGTTVFECKKAGLLVQSVVFLIIMLLAWIPTACVVWGFHRYPASMIITICNIAVTYGICWGIQYKYCRKEIETINRMLKEERKENAHSDRDP